MTPDLHQWVTTSTTSSEVSSTGEDFDVPRCEWYFHVAAVISPTASQNQAPDILGAAEFDPSNRLIATGGRARKLRLYNLSSILPSGELDAPLFADNATTCHQYIYTPAKLSSLRWKPDSGSRVIGSGDYDGVVTEYDLERHGAVLFERDEHGGRRVWSIDYSRSTPQLGASGSEDGATQLWDTRCGSGCGVLLPGDGGSRAPVCSVEFDPLGHPRLGLACADKRAYVYDLRMPSAGPTSVLVGHRRTVTYVRLNGDGRRVVTSSVDGSIKAWDVAAAEAREVRSYERHVNTRSFVGLSVWRAGGLLGCGSESNEVYVYDMRWGEPIAVQGFGKREEGGFVSSVCWRQVDGEEDECMLLTGGSNGVLQVSIGKKRRA